MADNTACDLFSHRPYWAKRLLPVAILPRSRSEMERYGWDACDVIIVTGDAYVDLPSFGMALIGRLLEAQGFRVGIIDQPDWQSAEPFTVLGAPTLFFGVTAGNMDSMVNRYTADGRMRSDDAYTPGGEGGKRPDRSVVVYSQRCREAYKGVPIVIGGIEASLRRLAHYDYWSDTVRRSILLDARADILLYGNAERAVVELAHRLARGEPIAEIRDLRGTAFLLKPCESLPQWQELNATVAGVEPHLAPGQNSKGARQNQVVRLPAYEQLRGDKLLYAHASRHFHLETNPGNARPLVQRHGERDLWVNPPPIPLSSAELDRLYELPYSRKPHPDYHASSLPAYEMIRFSINIMRGCFGGCTFCSITEHEGRIIQSRSQASVLREIATIRDESPDFHGHISDLGGPTANMYQLRCQDAAIEAACRRLSCVYPEICPHMGTDHQPLIDLYRSARQLPGIKRIFIASGLRYDLALRTPEYIKELVTHHVGGYLKVAPEHTEPAALGAMMKPAIAIYDEFQRQFDRYSRAAGKEQYLIPYFISAHPGSRDADMVNLALWLKQRKLRLDQVQNFLPTPMALATTMYHTGLSPLRRVTADGAAISVARGGRQRRAHKALLRYHDPANWPIIRQLLQEIGRADLIGSGDKALVPAEKYPLKRAASAHNSVVKKSRKTARYAPRKRD
ncbi:MAG: YgiQ family radical SAM protein [Gammaproteobacteria bacterium]|nr:YgiQ family radical SAM protein [Gammaproteobacteria bacterium]